MNMRTKGLSSTLTETEPGGRDGSPTGSRSVSSIEETIEAAVERAVERSLAKYLRASGDHPEPAVYTVSQAAQVLQVSHDTIWRMVKRGDLRRVPLLSGKTLIPRRAIDDMLDSGGAAAENHRLIRLKPCRPSDGPSGPRLLDQSRE